MIKATDFDDHILIQIELQSIFELLTIFSKFLSAIPASIFMTPAS